MKRIALSIAVVSLAALAVGSKANAQEFHEGNLLVSRSVYDNNSNNVTSSTKLPPNCPTTASCKTKGSLTPTGTYPQVFNNNLYDGSFGITSKIILDELDPRKGIVVNSLEVPNSSMPGITSESDQMVTSFSSKSELALNRSLWGKYVTFMGYVASIDALDVSNSNTPLLVDPTNPVGENYYRVVAQVDKHGHFHFTLTNAYSGNNGRAAILNDNWARVIYTAGNAGNGSNPQPNGVIGGTGAQIITPSTSPERLQSPGDPTPVGSFNVTQLGDTADKTGKDTNFRGLTVFNNVVYFTKGSGGNGIDTVYFIDTTGSACPGGAGLPSPKAVLPTTGVDPTYDFSGSGAAVTPYNMCILKGFPTTFPDSTTTVFPFGLFFADENTLYVADEGSGDNTYSTTSSTYINAVSQTMAGLQKWVFDPTSRSWKYLYTLQTGLNLGVPYTVTGYPTGNNAATALPWSPATDGLRNVTGRVEGDCDDRFPHFFDNRTATIWAVTSTVSGGGDQGADPNKLVKVTDIVKNTDPSVAASESFSTVLSAGFAEVLRGVSDTPGADFDE